MAEHKFDKVEFEDKEQAKRDANDNPKTRGLAAVANRVEAIEKLMGIQ